MASRRLGAGRISPGADTQGLVHMRADEGEGQADGLPGHIFRLSVMLAAYVGLSRAKLKETVLITQPFSP
eukprot:4765400-Karenia_brevis.AAC.1